MACYLCAYLSPERPYSPERLPAGSPISPSWPLGTCAVCSVLACSEHATRYGAFECALCQPATATKQALGVPGPVGSAESASLALAHTIGERATEEQRERTRQAIKRIVEAGEEARAKDRGRPALTRDIGDGPGNLIGNLAGAIRAQMRIERGNERDLIAGVQASGEDGEEWRAAGLVSLDAIGASVAATFANRALRTDALSTTAVTGALLMAMGTAEEQTPPVHLRAHREQLAGIEVRPPWEVSHPVLLDPVIWMVATAYYS